MIMYSETYENQKNIIRIMGWVWNEENKYFQHPKSNQIFYSAYMNWDNKKWLVPIFSDHNEIDKVTSRTWKMDLAAGFSRYVLKMNNPYDFKIQEEKKI